MRRNTAWTSATTSCPSTMSAVRFGHAQGHVEHGAVLGGVDVRAGEHGVTAVFDAGRPGQVAQERQRLVGDPVLGVVQVEVRRPRRCSRVARSAPRRRTGADGARRSHRSAWPGPPFGAAGEIDHRYLVSLGTAMARLRVRRWPTATLRLLGSVMRPSGRASAMWPFRSVGAVASVREVPVASDVASGGGRGRGSRRSTPFFVRWAPPRKQVRTAWNECHVARLAGDLVFAEGATLSATDVAGRTGTAEQVLSSVADPGDGRPQPDTPMFSARDADSRSS